MYIIDTNILMSMSSTEDLLKNYEEVSIPIEVLYELDELKTAPGERGFKARRAIKHIEKHLDSFNFLKHDKEDEFIFDLSMTSTDDIIIEYCKKYPDSILFTNDISMKLKATALGIKAKTYHEPNVAKPSLTRVQMTPEELEEFNKELINIYNIAPGQFLCIEDKETLQIKEIKKYQGEKYWEAVDLKGNIKNYLFSVYARDEYQSCAINSLLNDEFTVLIGPAGTGKTLLSIAYCLKAIKDEGAKVHIFVNPVKTRDTECLGFYPGSRDEKLLQNFIGAILTNKIGDMIEVKELMEEGYLNIYPFSDIRGIEIKEGDILYITEAQNLSIDLIKLAIQRCADGSKIIIEGDPNTQVDKEAFQENNNGLKRVISVFTGDEVNDFSYIYLPNIYRSRIAEKAEQL